MDWDKPWDDIDVTYESDLRKSQRLQRAAARRRDRRLAALACAPGKSTSGIKPDGGFLTNGLTRPALSDIYIFIPTQKGESQKGHHSHPKDEDTK